MRWPKAWRSSSVAKVIRVVIPDAGVLISLARGGLIELLISFHDNVRVYITDVVEYEVTNAPNIADAQALRSFLTARASRIQIEATGFAEMLKLVRAGKLEMPRGLGENSIYGYVNAMKPPSPGEPTLVIFEDSWFISNAAAVRPGNIHLLSTRGFLKGIQKLIPSFDAERAIAGIVRHRGPIQFCCD